MQIHDVMTSDVEVIRPNATIQEAARRMRDLNIGSLPVCDGNRILGMVSDRDITLRATAMGLDPTRVRVEEVMSTDVVYCYEDDDVNEAGRLMGYNQIRRLPILNREKKLVGIVSLGDISISSHDEDLPGSTLKEVSVPTDSQRNI